LENAITLPPGLDALLVGGCTMTSVAVMVVLSVVPSTRTGTPLVTALIEATGDRAMIMRRAARAAAYLLTVTAQPQESGKPDLSQELLEKLRDHPDEVTARLSRWALSFRFGPDGSVRPLLDAPEYETIEDSPYFAVSDKDGKFTIKDVPPGQYTNTVRAQDGAGNYSKQASNIFG